MPRKYHRSTDPGTIATITTMRQSGRTKRQIAKDLGMHVQTVKKTIDVADIDRKIAATRDQLADLAPLAVKSVEHHLINKNERVTMQYLEGIGAFSPDNARSKGDVSLNVAIANLLPPTSDKPPVSTDATINTSVVQSDPSTQNAGGDGKSNT